MPKLNGKAPRVLEGEKNPRHFIMIPVGTGNQYCCNCEKLNVDSCRIFGIGLKFNHRFGAERCPACRAAEKSLFDAKQEAKQSGEEAAFFKSNSAPLSRSTLMNAPA